MGRHPFEPFLGKERQITKGRNLSRVENVDSILALAFFHFPKSIGPFTKPGQKAPSRRVGFFTYPALGSLLQFLGHHQTIDAIKIGANVALSFSIAKRGGILD